jgi:Fungal fucose-specific lectin
VKIVESLVKPTVMAVVVAMTALTACTRDTAPTDIGRPAPSPPWSQYIWQTGDITDTTGAPPAGGGAITAYAFETQGTQHVIYSSALDNHVRELWWNINGWHTADLTSVAGAPPAAKPITGYVFQAENTQHVVYNGVDNRIHELWFDRTGWHTGDLTAAAAAPPVAAGGALAGYAFEAQHTQHVMYISAPDNHIRELWFDRTGWHTGDLTVATATPPVAAGGALAGYAFEAQHTQHVMYISAPDNHIRELWSDGAGWHISDLTATTGAPAAAAGGPLAAYPFERQRTQHIIYASGDGRLHELWCERTIWHTSDLTAATGAPPAQTLAGYAVEAQGTEHVVYSGLDHRLYELWWNSGWHLGDLTAATDAPAPGTGGPLGYAFEVQATQHVIYVSADDGHVREIWWGPPVHHGDSRLGGVPQASQATAGNAPRSSPTPP